MAMSVARVVIMAVVLEGRNKSEVARQYGVSRRWVPKVVARYRVEGEAAFEPRSRRPLTNPRRTAVGVEDVVVALRKQLSEDGPDAGAETIAWHLAQRGSPGPSVATIWRSRMLGNGHVWFGRRAAETGQSKDRHRAAARPHTHGAWPTAATWRSSTSSMTTPGCW
jgi:transposase-like protein